MELLIYFNSFIYLCLCGRRQEYRGEWDRESWAWIRCKWWEGLEGSCEVEGYSIDRNFNSMTLIYSYTVGLRMVCSEHICIGQQRVFLCCCFIFQFVRVCWWCRVLCSCLQTAADIGCCRSGNECMEHVVWCKNHLLQQYLWPFSFYTSYKRQVSCFVTVASLHSLTCGPDMVIVTDLEDFHFCTYVLLF